MTYLDDAAQRVRAALPDDVEVPDGSDNLFVLYAVLLRAKGAGTTAADVHDAWAAWMLQQDPDHHAIHPYQDLDAATQSEDSPFLAAILRAAAETE